MNKGKVAALALALIIKAQKRSIHEVDESSDDDSDDEFLISAKISRETQEKHAKITAFVKNVVSTYSLSDFKKHFRLSKSSVEELLKVIINKSMILGRPSTVPPLDGLLLTIWALATQETFREIGDRFDLSEGHTFRVFSNTCIKIAKNQNKYIVWPRGIHGLKNLNEFNNLRGDNSFPNVFGCVDGTHIAIPGPLGDNSYYNRKGYHSVQVQAICDSRCKFINIFSGWPGSVHDARVWQSSRVYQMLEEDPLSLLPPNTYLLGDSAYPLRCYLLVPYKDNGRLTRKQKQFNMKLSSTRVLIEQTFGRWKGLFRRLHYLNVFKLSNLKFIILACAVLHNISIDDRIAYNIDEVDENEDVPDNLEYEIPEQIPQAAVEIRNNVMNTIIQDGR